MATQLKHDAINPLPVSGVTLASKGIGCTKLIGRKVLIGALLFGVQTVRADTAPDNTVQLELKPGRCVALHQGQMCYQTIQLFWNANAPGNYCLYQQRSEPPLYCWQNVAAGQYQYEFASDTSVALQLVNTHTSMSVATAAIEVAWVYKANTRRKTHWRLF